MSSYFIIIHISTKSGWRVWTRMEGAGSTLPHGNTAGGGACNGACSDAGSGAWVP